MRSFTLIELLVVIAIVTTASAVLAEGAAPPPAGAPDQLGPFLPVPLPTGGGEKEGGDPQDPQEEDDDEEEGGDQRKLEAAKRQIGEERARTAAASKEAEAAKAKAEAAEATLKAFSANLSRIAEKPAEQREALVRQQVRQVNRRLTETKVIRQELSLEQLLSLMQRAGLYGPAQAWAAGYVDRAKARGLVVGTTDGYSSADPSCRVPMSRQDVGVAMLRHDDNAAAHAAAFGEHNAAASAHPEAFAAHDQNPEAHQGLVAALREEIASQSLWGKIAFWALVALLALALLWWVLARRGVVAGFTALGAVPPFAPGGGVPPLAAAPFVPFSRGVTRRI
jgi:hypothetical protein